MIKPRSSKNERRRPMGHTSSEAQAPMTSTAWNKLRCTLYFNGAKNNMKSANRCNKGNATANVSQAACSIGISGVVGWYVFVGRAVPTDKMEYDSCGFKPINLYSTPTAPENVKPKESKYTPAPTRQNTKGKSRAIHILQAGELMLQSESLCS